MVDVDVTHPGDTDFVSAFPANERASRAAILALTAGTALWGGTSGGTSDAQTVTVANTGLTLTAGLMVAFIAGSTSTAQNPTLTVNSLPPTVVNHYDGGNLVPAGLVSGRLHLVVYTGSAFRLLPQGPILLPSILMDNGSFQEYTGLPPGLRRIDMVFDQVGLSGTDDLQVRIGTAAGIETTGYASSVGTVRATSTLTPGPADNFLLAPGVASQRYTGVVTLSLRGDASNAWVMHGSLRRSNTALDASLVIDGVKDLTDNLTRVRVKASSAATFNAGRWVLVVE